MWQGVDNRKFPRADYPCKIVVIRGGMSEQFSTRTENIGKGGICVVLGKGLEKFCPVALTIYLKDSHPPLECDGRVVWAVKRRDLFDTGIEFLNIQGSDLERIERIVRECLRVRENSLPRS
jgi:c-di-GMP-binding flagellar brake protein YcgR